MRKNKFFYFIVGVVISCVFIYFLFKKIDINLLIKQIIKVRYSTLFLLLIIFLFSVLLKSYRWSLLINQKSKISFKNIFLSNNIGYLANTILPAKAGELIKVQILGREEKISRSYVLGTVVADRILDIITLLIFLLLSICFSETVQQVIKSNYIQIVLLLLLVVIFILFILNRNAHLVFLKIVPEILSKRLSNVLTNLNHSFSFFRGVKVFLLMFLSLIIWSFLLLSILLLLNNFQITIPFYAYFFVVSAGALGMIIPSAPGGIGVYHAVATASLMMFMVSKESALAIAIILNAFDIVPNIILGFISLLIKYHSISLKALETNNGVKHE
jgi:glycosyltransferase 2 family protein